MLWRDFFGQEAIEPIDHESTWVPNSERNSSGIRIKMEHF